MLTADKLRHLLDYNPTTGIFIWRVPHGSHNRFPAGVVAGYVSSSGHRQILIGTRRYLAHRLARLYETGVWPAGNLDHVDNNRANNAIANLRLATVSQNAWNSRKPKTNTSGFKGVSQDRRVKTRPYRAEIQANGHRRHLGHLRTPEEAHAAYCAAAKELHGEFARAA